MQDINPDSSVSRISWDTFIQLLRNVGILRLVAIVPFSKTETFKNFFLVAICRLWNDLPLRIRESSSLSIFRRISFPFPIMLSLMQISYDMIVFWLYYDWMQSMSHAVTYFLILFLSFLNCMIIDKLFSNSRWLIFKETCILF